MSGSEAPLTWLDAVSTVARLAGEKALTFFRRGVTVETKADGTPVTVADREAELAARAWLAQHFPEDGVVGEEGDTVRPDARRRWYVDPIDGTKAFVRGVPLWATLVAVAEGDEVLAGALFCPALNELVAAERGRGCFFNGAPTRVQTRRCSPPTRAGSPARSARCSTRRRSAARGVTVTGTSSSPPAAPR